MRSPLFLIIVTKSPYKSSVIRERHEKARDWFSNLRRMFSAHSKFPPLSLNFANLTRRIPTFWNNSHSPLRFHAVTKIIKWLLQRPSRATVLWLGKIYRSANPSEIPRSPVIFCISNHPPKPLRYWKELVLTKKKKKQILLDYERSTSPERNYR